MIYVTFLHITTGIMVIYENILLFLPIVILAIIIHNNEKTEEILLMYLHCNISATQKS